MITDSDGVERHQVLPRNVVRMPGVAAAGDDLAIPHNGAVFLHVQVERMHPTTAAVADLPEVEAVLFLLGQRRFTRRVLQAGRVVRRIEGLAVDQPLRLAGDGTTLHLEDQPVVQQALPIAGQRRQIAQRRRRSRHQTVVRCVVADHDLDHRNLVGSVRGEPGRIGPHPPVGHLHHVGQVEDITLGGRSAVLISREVDDHLTPLGRPQLEAVPFDRERQKAAVRGDLGELHALLGIRDPVLTLEFVAACSPVRPPFSGPASNSSV